MGIPYQLAWVVCQEWTPNEEVQVEEICRNLENADALLLHVRTCPDLELGLLASNLDLPIYLVSRCINSRHARIIGELCTLHSNLRRIDGDIVHLAKSCALLGSEGFAPNAGDRASDCLVRWLTMAATLGDRVILACHDVPFVMVRTPVEAALRLFAAARPEVSVTVLTSGADPCFRIGMIHNVHVRYAAARLPGVEIIHLPR